MRKIIEKAKRHLKKARELAKMRPSPFEGMSIEQAISKMRKVREKLWEEKFAISPRHK